MTEQILDQLAEKIEIADAILIGAGSGLSSAAGYDHYHWSPVLMKALAPFQEYYRFSSPFAGFYHCFSSCGAQWAYYSQARFPKTRSVFFKGTLDSVNVVSRVKTRFGKTTVWSNG